MEFDERQSIYLQIVDYISEGILKGRYQEGERIPSVREMAMDTEVNPNTVMRSYAELQERGIIQNQRGIGYFVSEGAYDQIREEKVRRLLGEEVPRIVEAVRVLEIPLQELVRTIEENYQEQSE
jgi:DNA-binding transcriptional regulator YhcF (GntR family)